MMARRRAAKALERVTEPPQSRNTPRRPGVGSAVTPPPVLVVSALLAAAALLLQIKAEVTRNPADSTKKDVSVGVSVGNRQDDRPPKRVPVTVEHLRTAFRTPLAKATLERARATRIAQDSALMSYEATAYLRISAGMGFSRIGRDRLIFRHENVTHVKWHRDVGAWIDVA